MVAHGLKLCPASSAQIEEGDANMDAPVITPSSSTESVNKVPVVKAKATHIIMNSLITSKSSLFCSVMTNGVLAHEWSVNVLR